MQNHFIIGVDEVGRGCLIGDVVVCAAIFANAELVVSDDSQSEQLATADSVRLLPNHPLSALTDSKKLSEKKRDRLFADLEQATLAHRVIKVSATMIDQMNILQATLLGMKQAVAGVITATLATHPDATFSVVVDGNKLPTLTDIPHAERITHAQAIIKGDGKHVVISAASVLAKVSRDRDMIALAAKFPQYGLDQHKGYPTKSHVAAITTHGVLPMHRKSFAPVKKLLAPQ